MWTTLLFVQNKVPLHTYTRVCVVSHIQCMSKWKYNMEKMEKKNKYVLEGEYKMTEKERNTVIIIDIQII